MTRFNDITERRIELYLTGEIYLVLDIMRPINPDNKIARQIAAEYNELTIEREKIINPGCAHHWLGSGSDKSGRLYCTKCGEAKPWFNIKS